MTTKYNFRSPIFLQGIKFHIFDVFWVLKQCRMQHCDFFVEVPELSYFVMLLKIEIESFPNMETMSHTSYSN